MSPTSIYVMSAMLVPLMIGLEAVAPLITRPGFPRWPTFVLQVMARFAQLFIVFVTGHIAGGEFIKQLYGL